MPIYTLFTIIFPARLTWCRILLVLLFCPWLKGQPNFSQHPEDVTVVPEQTGVFKVNAFGSGTLTYQWFRNNLPLEESNSNTLYAPPAEPHHDGDAYHVEVTDSNGIALSLVGTLEISDYSSDMEMTTPDHEDAAYYIDAINGNDETGNGSATAPYKTFNKVRPLLKGGELVLFNKGSYGNIEFIRSMGIPSSEFSDWVTLMAVPGEDVKVDKVFMQGSMNSSRILWNGSFDLKVRIIGFHIREGVNIENINLVRIEDCLLNLPGPLIGSVGNVDRSTVRVRGGRSITVEDCEITNTAIGLGMRGNDLTVRRNHIHHISHDGIRLTGCDVVRIDGNRIYNSDDGYDDSVDWARHCDGMHFYKENDNSVSPIDQNNNIYVRGNMIYHHETAGWIAQGLHTARNWVVENNVFGPTGGFMLHLKLAVDRFIFRHNTIVMDADGYYQGLYRRIDLDNYDIALPCYNSSSGVEIYNNILTHPFAWDEYNLTSEHCDVFTNNYFYRYESITELGKNPKVERRWPFAVEGYDAFIARDSIAVGGGTAQNPVASDLYGKPRANPPTIGAVEFIEDNEAPTIPENLTTTPQANAVHLEWEASGDNLSVTGYKVFRNGTEIGISDSLDYLDTDVEPQSSYSYKVLAFDPYGNESAYSESVEVTTLDPEQTWLGYPIIEGYVDTGSWMGFVYVANAPWVHLYLLDKWINTPDDTIRNGIWGYFPR